MTRIAGIDTTRAVARAMAAHRARVAAAADDRARRAAEADLRRVVSVLMVGDVQYRSGGGVSDTLRGAIAYWDQA